MHLPFGIPANRVSIQLIILKFGAIIQRLRLKIVKITDVFYKVNYLYLVTVETVK